MSRTQQVHIKPDRSWHPRRQLAEESVSRVDIGSLAVLRAQQAALLRRFSGIMASQKRLEITVPLIHEIQPALLHPSVEVVLRDLVGEVKDAIVRSQNLYRSLFDRNPCPAELCGIRRKFPFVEIRDTSVVLRHQRASVVDEIE